MIIDEGRRHALSKKLEEVLGLEEAVTLMQQLPPVPWADFATKDYVDLRLQATEQLLKATIKDEVGALQSEITQQTRTMVFSVIGLLVTMVLGLVGVVFSMAQMLGT